MYRRHINRPQSFGSRFYPASYKPRAVTSVPSQRYVRKTAKRYKRKADAVRPSSFNGYYKRRYYRARSYTVRAAAAGAAVNQLMYAPADKMGLLARQVAQTASPCVKKWLRLVLDPFGGMVEGCNPFTFPLDAEKCTAWVRFTIDSGWFGTAAGGGAVGNCYMVIIPCNPCNDTDICYRGGAATTNLTTLNSLTGSTAMTNSSFSQYDFSTNPNTGGWAPVASGFRFRYTGPAQSRMGFCIVSESPAHRNFYDSTVTGQACASLDQSVSLPITSDWTTVVWGGVRRPEEQSWQSGVQLGTNLFGSLFILLSGISDTTAQNFECEYISHFEAYGGKARGFRPSDQDLRASFAQTLLSASGRSMTNPQESMMFRTLFDENVDTVRAQPYDRATGQLKMVARRNYRTAF